MEYTANTGHGLKFFDLNIFRDERGAAFTNFDEDIYNLPGLIDPLVSWTVTTSKNNVLRGIYYQMPPLEQGRLITIMTGAVQLVAVDLRPNSKAFGDAGSYDAEKGTQVWLPPGFAQGYLSLENGTTVIEGFTKIIHKGYERTVPWYDRNLKIHWKVEEPIVSDKDSEGIYLKYLKAEIKNMQDDASF